MAKDLPYFKFFCSEWNDGDITLETYEHQGLFINICSYYWSNECNVPYDKLLKRFRGCDDLLNDLSAAGLFKIVEGRYLSISFLDEQQEEREETSKKNSYAGKLSAKKRALKKLEEQKANELATETQRALNLRSTETQPLREDKRREEEIIEDNIELYRSFAHLKLSTEDFNKLLEKYNKEQIDNILNNIENFKNNKKYKSLYLTSLNWLKREYPNKEDFVPKIPYPTKDDEVFKYAVTVFKTKEEYWKHKEALRIQFVSWSVSGWKDYKNQPIINWKKSVCDKINFLIK